MASQTKSKFVLALTLRAAVLLIGTSMSVSAHSLTLNPSLPSGQPVGTAITWKADDPEAVQGTTYQFSIARQDETLMVAKDFSLDNSFLWRPIDEGYYDIRVVTKPKFGSPVRDEAMASYVVSSRIIGNKAIVTAIEQPLVAFYSAPPCTSGRMYVAFSAKGSQIWRGTSAKPCISGQSMNFYVAGMRPKTTFRMRHVTVNGSSQEFSPIVQFTTGKLPRRFPAFWVRDLPDDQTSWLDDIVLRSVLDLIKGQTNLAVATDLAGKVTWYVDRLRGAPDGFFYLSRPVADGNMLYLVTCCAGLQHVVVEADLTGQVIRQTNMSRINEQLLARGDQPVRTIHHDAVRFPNGHTLILGFIEQPGSPPTMGDMVIALDENFQVVWTWNAFEHLDTARRAVLNETCAIAYGDACAASTPLAHDWLHSNSIAYSPKDRNLIVSMRHQDWVIKLDYRDGTGSGEVLWRLGKDGDFIIASSDAYPWFSHQHDATYVGSNRIALFDNGNTRCIRQFPLCSSRGQVLELDEDTRVARLVHNVDLGRYSPRHGSAQLLGNGNYHFGSGFILPELSSRSTETTPNGAMTFELQTNVIEYRSTRMRSLYNP